MSGNTHFSLAVHALTVLAVRDELTTSAFVAESVNTNPVVVRRALGALVAAGLVRSVPGKHGGFALARPAKSIRLADVRAAVDDSDVIRIHANEPNPACTVSCQIKDVLERVRGSVESAVEAELEKTTLADVAREIG